MTGIETKRLVDAYFEDGIEPIHFLSGFFQAPEINFYNGQKVEIDIVRSEEDISIAIADLSVEARKNSLDFFTNKEFTAPVHMEMIALNSEDLLKRSPGATTHKDHTFQATLTEMILRGMSKIRQKVQRSIELQAAQVLTTGAISIVDADSNSIYDLNFAPKASHFPMAGTSWASATAEQKIEDLRTLCNEIRKDGKRKVDQSIWGEKDWENFIQTDGIKDRINFRRADTADIVEPEVRGNGGTWHGRITVGDNNIEVWTYDGQYKDPVSGDIVKYIPDGKIILRSSKGRLDATFGNIPNIGKILGLQPIINVGIPERMSSSKFGLDFFTDIYKSKNGRQFFGEIGSRPLLIPTAIDTFGCLDTQL